MIKLLPPKSRLLSASSGLLLAAACPPLDLYPLAWIALLPLFKSLELPEATGWREGAAAAIAYNIALLYWLAFNSGTNPFVASATMVASVAVVSAGWILAAWLFFLIYRRFGSRSWICVPFAWTAWEGWLSHMGELAFPWAHLSLSQAGFSPILQLAEFTGIPGISFWLVTLNLLLFIFLSKHGSVRKMAGVGSVLMFVIPLITHLNAEKYSSKSFVNKRIAVIQGSVRAHDKWFKGAEYSWAIYDSLSRECEKDSVDLIVWPETALPVHLMHQSKFANKLADLTNDLDSWILTGASDYNRVDSLYKPLNSAFLTGPGAGIIERTAKRFLVPFGERVPFQGIFPQLGKLNFGQAEFMPGVRQTLFEIPDGDDTLRFPAMICYESIFPWISRDAVRRGANLLTTISNDGWYGRTSEPAQIAALSRFRCIETRRAMARSSNSGISALIDPLGREIVRTKLFEATYIVADLPLSDVETFYTKFGDLFLIVVTAIYGGFLLIFAFLWKRY